MGRKRKEVLQQEAIAARQGKPMPAYAYVRVSTEEQAREGISIDGQHAKIEQYARLQGLALVEVFVDEGKSAKDLERPALQKLFAVIDQPFEKTLIIYKLDRLSRNAEDALGLLKRRLPASRTRLVSLSENLDTSTAAGMMFVTMMAGFAEMERGAISERTKFALARKKERGDRLGTTPLGFITDKDTKQLRINPEELAVVQRIFDEREAGATLIAIADGLNRDGIPTKRNKRWHPYTVQYVVENKRYAAALTNERGIA